MPQEVNSIIFAVTFPAAVPRVIIIAAVTAAPAIRLVVLVIVGIEVVQSEAVVAGNEVY